MGVDLNEYVERKLKQELWINAICTIVSLLLSIVFLIKGEEWWVTGFFFAFFIYGIFETIKSKKAYEDYKSDKLEY